MIGMADYYVRNPYACITIIYRDSKVEGDEGVLDLLEREKAKDVSKKTLGEFIAQQRLKLGIPSKAELARRSFLSPSVISELETGKETGSFETIISVAKGLGLRPGILLDVYAELPPELPIEPDVLALANSIAQLSPVTQQQVRELVNLLADLENKQSQLAKTSEPSVNDISVQSNDVAGESVSTMTKETSQPTGATDSEFTPEHLAARQEAKREVQQRAAEREAARKQKEEKDKEEADATKENNKGSKPSK